MKNRERNCKSSITYILLIFIFTYKYSASDRHVIQSHHVIQHSTYNYTITIHSSPPSYHIPIVYNMATRLANTIIHPLSRRHRLPYLLTYLLLWRTSNSPRSRTSIFIKGIVNPLLFICHAPLFTQPIQLLSHLNALFRLFLTLCHDPRWTLGRTGADDTGLSLSSSVSR